MQTQVKLHPDKSQAELTISVEADEFKPHVERAARKLSKERPLKGFRPGKAPLSVVAEMLGQDRLLHEAMDLALPHFFVEAAVANKVEAINRPAITIKKLGLDQPFEFVAVVDVLPEVKVGDVSKITVERKSMQVTPEDVDRELTLLAKMRSSLIDMPRPAERGDTVTVDFEVRVNGAVIEGGASQNHPVHLGEGHFVPDFEKKLEGIQGGDTRQFTIGFPKDFPKKEHAGKTAEVSVKAHSVQKRVLPTIDDAFAKNLGKFKDLAALKETLKKNIGLEKEQREKERYQQELLEKLAEVTVFGPIPEALVEQEIEQRLREFAEMLAYQHQTVQEYLARQAKSLADMKKDMRTSAEKSVKAALALRAYATQAKITVSPEEIEQKANEYLSRFRSPGEAEKQVNPKELHERMERVVRNQKTLAHLEAALAPPAAQAASPKKDA